MAPVCVWQRLNVILHCLSSHESQRATHLFDLDLLALIVGIVGQTQPCTLEHLVPVEEVLALDDQQDLDHVCCERARENEERNSAREQQSNPIQSSIQSSIHPIQSNPIQSNPMQSNPRRGWLLESARE